MSFEGSYLSFEHTIQISFLAGTVAQVAIGFIRLTHWSRQISLSWPECASTGVRRANATSLHCLPHGCPFCFAKGNHLRKPPNERAI